MRRWLVHGLLIGALTLLTQVGGVIYGAALWLRRFSPRFQSRAGFAGLFVGLYAVLWLPVSWLAAATGREPLPCIAEEGLSAAPFACVLHRHYVTPDLAEIAVELTRAVDARFPGAVTRALDANFPFIDGFPLPPHLSHDDGEKLDLSFFYARDGVYQPAVMASPIGYWRFEQPRDGEPQACAGNAGPLRWDMQWFAPLTRRDLELDEERTRFALRWLAQEGVQRGVGKVFVEPHLAQRLGVRGGVIRFQGCYAARHDDHIHVQLR